MRSPEGTSILPSLPQPSSPSPFLYILRTKPVRNIDLLPNQSSKSPGVTLSPREESSTAIYHPETEVLKNLLYCYFFIAVLSQ